jgi:MoaA/NifB/PqqE/SkfB family radical SAM enzyme
MKPAETAQRDKVRVKKPLVAAKFDKFSEKYARGESIAIVQLQYNYQCNLKCVHCSIEPLQHSARRRLTPNDLKGIYDQAHALGLARTVITGGEPLTFKDLEAVVQAIGPERFYINLDTNGYLLDARRANELAALGVDRIQLSIDSLDALEHDRFRQRLGSWQRANEAIGNARRAGLDIFIQTVVTKERLHSREFLNFLEHYNSRGLMVFVTFAKPVGAWAGRPGFLIDEADLVFMRGLEKKYRTCTHLTPAYDLDMGCIAVKGMLSITQYGDVQPCPYMHISLGSVFNEPLETIINRGLGIKWFGEHVDTCPIAMDRNFIDNHIRPVEKGAIAYCGDVFSVKDATRVPFQTIQPKP